MSYQISDVFLGVPTRGSLNWNHVKAMYTLMAENPNLNQPELEAGGLSVCNVRNALVQKFLSTPAKVLFFVDDDVVPRTTILQMLSRLDEYDIVGAPYPLVHPPVCPIPTPCAFKVVRENAYRPLDDVFSLRGVHPVDALGTGCMMIKRAVLEHPDVMPFQLGVTDKGIMVMSEDVLFCQRAKQAGFTIAADFDQVADHCHSLSLNAIHTEYLKKLTKAIEIVDQAKAKSLITVG